MDAQLNYATRRIIELENLLLMDVPETVWPAEVGVVFSQVDNAGLLPAHHQRRLKHHINRMWLEKMPVPAIVTVTVSLAYIMESLKGKVVVEFLKGETLIEVNPAEKAGLKILS